MKKSIIRYGTELRIFDNGGKTYDRYTIVPPRYASGEREKGRLWCAILSSSDPFHPLGFGQFCSVMVGSHLGKRIHWDELPGQVKQFATQSFPEYSIEKDKE